MFNLPKFQKITQVRDLQLFAKKYEGLSGLPVPLDYLTQEGNHVFGVYVNSELSGGFVLAGSGKYRTVQFFASEANQDKIYQQMEGKQFTEICCFWMARGIQKNQTINLLTWAYLSLSLVRFGHPFIIFGTCSARLANLYDVSSRVHALHEDVVKAKQTFIFYARQKSSLPGIFEIMLYKLKRSITAKLQSRPSKNPASGRTHIKSVQKRSLGSSIV
jgi:hypothetical protein